ncbi:ElaA protein [Stackebrandtia endophytica]|uniref:ElaA protein n=1 Tax=Stackebrandtia endophytica TaxID=1496996 RepID=A0A543B325_9ACTN|nr:GNAT family N-acetyltransferase [Stackebrandtia endophytica]TQL79248.1 ElaA protein [Stackebrandtia endophytica]
MTVPPSEAVAVRRFDEMDAATLYRLLRLRVAVFVVEQNCPYQELDDRDTDAGTRHLWMERDGEVAGYLRVLSEPDGFRIGRVCTASPSRGHGVGRLLMARAMELIGGAPAVLDSQTYAREFYSRFGFVSEGEEFLEDDIPHIRMRRT